MTYRTRYAPSPTGALHLGHARTHLLTWLRARQEHGAIVMRLEDIDTPRVRPESEAAILRDHEWLGLDWDEGPVRQSERTELYVAALEVLCAAGHLYPCTCSRKEIAEVASAPHATEPVYPGLCRERPRHPGRPAALRFRFDDPSPGFVDGLAGPFAEGRVRGDFVVRRADGLWAYQLAVVVDDAAQRITEVVRGDDLLESTPRQLALYRALGHPAPAFVHVPLLLDAGGVRLSKRASAVAIADYRDAGVTREALLGKLAFSLGLRPASAPVSLGDLLGDFTLERVRRASGIVDETFALPEPLAR